MIFFFTISGSHLVLKAIKAMVADDCDEVSFNVIKSSNFFTSLA